MTVINRNAIVPYSPAQMFTLVDNVEEYPQFLPWCKSAQVLSRTEDEVRATLNLERAGIEKSFTTCNRIQKDKMIEIRLLNGPFKQLEGFWRFDAMAQQGCQVSLDLEFEFANYLLGLLFGPVFHQVVDTLVDAFCNRAAKVYG